MVCHHLEILAADIENLGIEKVPGQYNLMDDCECIYFDCRLDRKSIRSKSHFPDFIEDLILPNAEGHPEEGFICKRCNLVVMGAHPAAMPGYRTFGYSEAGKPHLVQFSDNSVLEGPSVPEPEKPLKPKSRLPGLPTITFAILLGLPIALYQYLPNRMMLGFIAGICLLMITPIILSPVMQFFRGRSNYTFPFFGIFIVLLMGVPLFVIYGWDAIVYVLAVYAGIAFFGSILLRVLRKKK